jgi:hypothetical protein
MWTDVSVWGVLGSVVQPVTATSRLFESERQLTVGKKPRPVAIPYVTSDHGAISTVAAVSAVAAAAVECWLEPNITLGMAGCSYVGNR